MNLVKLDVGKFGVEEVGSIRVPLPTGGAVEVVLGRNALCAIVDPLVSRRQASVEWEAARGRWVLRALANSRCRHRPNRGQWTSLEKGNAVTLDKGDQFSLLKERHVYQVQLEALEEEREEEDVALETSRKLPAWMIEIDEEVEPDRPLPAFRPAPKLPRLAEKKEYLDNTRVGDDTLDEVLHPDTSTPRKRSPREPYPAVPELDDEGNATASPQKESRVADHGVSDSDVEETEPDRGSPLPGPSTKGDEATEVDTGNAPLRQKCPFGSGCYRQNPQHKIDMAHPGDADFTDQSDTKSGEDDDRPECEYGLDCYRKNPQHRVDYKHLPRPKRAAAKKANDKKAPKKQKVNDSNEEYDSSFIDDDSEKDLTTDEDEEEEWLPPDSDL